MHTLDLCRARNEEIPSTSLPQQWHKPRGKKITGQPVSKVVVAKAKINRKRKPIMSSYIHEKYVLYFPAIPLITVAAFQSLNFKTHFTTFAVRTYSCGSLTFGPQKTAVMTKTKV